MISWLETDPRDPNRLQQQKIWSKVTHQGEACLHSLSVALVFACLLSVYLSVCIPLVIALSASQHVCVFIFLLSLSIHQSCSESFEVIEQSILVISGCHHKRLHATTLTCQKGPCVQTKNLCYVTLWCCRCCCCFWQWSRAGENRGEGEKRGAAMSV